MSEQVNLNIPIIDNEDDLQNLQNFIIFKNNLMNAIGIDNFIDNVREIINNCEHFEFRSSRAEKFINKNNPIFIIKLKDEYYKKYKDMNLTKEDILDNITDEVVNFIRDDIITNVSAYINDAIFKNEKLVEYFNTFDQTIKDIAISNIYGIRNSIADNIIYLEYFK